MKKGRIWVSGLTAAFLMICAAGPLSLAQSATLRVVGAAEMAGLVDRWAKAFQKSYAGTDVVVYGSDSQKGYQALIDGNADIAMVTVVPTPELEKSAAQKGVEFKRQQIGFGGIVLVGSADVPVDELSLEDAAKIFTGEYNSWNQVGGPAGAIHANCVDPKRHGEAAWFHRRVMKEAPFGAKVDIKEDTRLVLLHTARKASSIGCCSLRMYHAVMRSESGLKGKLKLIKIKPAGSSEGVAPTEASIANMSYPLLVPFYLCTKEKNTREDIQRFTEFVLEQSRRMIQEALYGESSR